MNEDVSYHKGKLETIPNTNIPGRLLIATDTGDCFLDVDDNKRTRLVDSTKIPLYGGILPSGAYLDFNGVKISSDGLYLDDNAKKKFITDLNIKIIKDVTEDYLNWESTIDTQKTVENYAKTLADGRYRVVDDAIGRYEMEIFTVVNGQQYRIIRDYTDEFCYIDFYCGDTNVLHLDSETGEVQVGSRKMITNNNIPLPTTEDIGKILVASDANSAVWAAITNAEEVAF